MRPIVLVIAGLWLLTACGASGPEDQVGAMGSPSNEGELFANRADQWAEDRESELGVAAGYAGLNVTVSDARESDGRMVVTVTVFNRREEAQPLSIDHWTLQLPSDERYRAESVGTVPPTVAPGSTVDFEVSVGPFEESGDHYLIHWPGGFDPSRGIWKINPPG